MCPYFSPDTQNILQHIVRRHRNSASFIAHCNASGCGASFRNYNSFKIHVKRRHGSDNTTTVVADTQEDDDESDEPVDELNIELDTSKAEAAFLLKLKAGRHISDAGIEEVISSVRALYQDRFDAIKRSLPGEVLENVEHLLDCRTAFSELDTKYKRERYLKYQLGAVMPQPVVMGEHVARAKRNGRSKLLTKKDTGYYVPFLENLRSFLSMPEVQNSICDAGPLSQELMIDVIDGTFLRDSDFLEKYHNSLLIAAYGDDFEIVNPIGSHTRHHKLSIFYYVLLNIPPEFRSKLSVIQLIAVAKSVDIKKYGASSGNQGSHKNVIKQLDNFSMALSNTYVPCWIHLNSYH